MPIGARQAFKIGHGDAFVGLVDGAVERAELDHLGTGRGDEAPVRRAAAGVGVRFDAQFPADGRAHGLDQARAAGQERLAGERPGQFVVEAMALQDVIGASAQVVGRDRGREAEVEPDLGAAE